MTSETCAFCGTAFEVPDGSHARAEKTADMPPPAMVVVWRVPDGAKFPPTWEDEWLLHTCRSGVADD